MIDPDQPTRSPSSLVSIDGGKVKFIRESKGLTQLYISTFLGVTTDTVSRWENRKYPKVKWENVEKLAQALEVDVEEIIDYREEEKPAAQPAPPAPTQKAEKSGRRLIAIVASLFLVLLACAVILSLTRQEVVSITATRFLPKHIPAGQAFPVVVRVESGSEQPFSFILQETLPENLHAVKGIPEIVSVDTKNNTVKWISSSKQSPFYLAYLVQAAPESMTAGKVAFTGQIKADNAPRFEQNVAGDSITEVSDYHWADSNTDGVIDDEEILMVYSSAEVLKSLGVDMDRIQEIWSSGGYTWNPEKNDYQIVE